MKKLIVASLFTLLAACGYEPDQDSTNQQRKGDTISSSGLQFKLLPMEGNKTKLTVKFPNKTPHKRLLISLLTQLGDDIASRTKETIEATYTNDTEWEFILDSPGNRQALIWKIVGDEDNMGGGKLNLSIGPFAKVLADTVIQGRPSTYQIFYPTSFHTPGFGLLTPKDVVTVLSGELVGWGTEPVVTSHITTLQGQSYDLNGARDVQMYIVDQEGNYPIKGSHYYGWDISLINQLPIGTSGFMTLFADNQPIFKIDQSTFLQGQLGAITFSYLNEPKGNRIWLPVVNYTTGTGSNPYENYQIHVGYTPESGIEHLEGKIASMDYMFSLSDDFSKASINTILPQYFFNNDYVGTYFMLPVFIDVPSDFNTGLVLHIENSQPRSYFLRYHPYPYDFASSFTLEPIH